MSLKKLKININVSSVFSTKSLSILNFKYEINKGAKRKSERTPVLPAENLINIAKSRQDPIILTDEYYPKWLHDELNPEKNLINTPFQLEYMALMGMGIPNENQVLDILQKCKRQNYLKKRIMKSFYKNPKLNNKADHKRYKEDNDEYDYFMSDSDEDLDEEDIDGEDEDEDDDE